MKYYALVDLGKRKKRRWQAIASIPAFDNSCIAGAEAVFRALGFKFHWARGKSVEKQRNFAGFAPDYVAFDLAYESYVFLCDLEHAQRLVRIQESWNRILDVIGDDPDDSLVEIAQRRQAVIAEFSEWL